MPRKVTIKNKALDAGSAREQHRDGGQVQREIPPDVKAMMNVCDFLRDRVKSKRAKIENEGRFRTYFRADQMIQLIEQNHTKIEKILKGTKYQKEPGELKEIQNILELGQQILNLGLCIRLSRTNDSKLLKWPKELLYKPGSIQFTKKSCFLSITFEPDPRKRHIKLLFIIIGILCIALYPIWPLQLRIFVFKASFYLLISLVILTVIRYVLFGFLWIFGIHFWIFPNLYADVGFFDSFKPLFSTGYQFEKNALAYIGRIAIIAVYSFTIWYYFTYYDQFLNLRAGYSAGVQDIYDWGETKIAMKPTEPNMQNFRRTRNWYDEMMDQWTKEDNTEGQKNTQESSTKQSEQVNTDKVQNSDRMSDSEMQPELELEEDEDDQEEEDDEDDEDDEEEDEVEQTKNAKVK